MTQDDHSADAEEIWEKEMAIFEGRARGDLTPYISVISENYLGWPPTMPDPLTMTNFKADAKMQLALRGEVLKAEKRGITFSGDTALTYFSTHRTMLGEGFSENGSREVDQRYENIHVWAREKSGWRLVGGMARAQPDRG